MKVVAQNSAKEIAEHHAKERIKSCWRVLTANILRIAAGAGKPYLILSQMADYAQATHDYEAATGFPFSPENHLAHFANADVALREHRDWIKPEHLEDEEHYAERQIIDGAMRTHAAMLLDQQTQVSIAMNMLCAGIRDRNKAIQARQKGRVR